MSWLFAAASDYTGVWVALISSGLLFVGNMLVNRRQEQTKDEARKNDLKDELNETLEARLKQVKDDYIDLLDQHNELKQSHENCERQIAAQDEEITALEWKYEALKKFVVRRLGDVPEGT